jgi:hypothetical protein
VNYVTRGRSLRVKNYCRPVMLMVFLTHARFPGVIAKRFHHTLIGG